MAGERFSARKQIISAADKPNKLSELDGEPFLLFFAFNEWEICIHENKTLTFKRCQQPLEPPFFHLLPIKRASLHNLHLAPRETWFGMKPPPLHTFGLWLCCVLLLSFERLVSHWLPNFHFIQNLSFRVAKQIKPKHPAAWLAAWDLMWEAAFYCSTFLKAGCTGFGVLHEWEERSALLSNVSIIRLLNNLKQTVERPHHHQLQKQKSRSISSLVCSWRKQLPIISSAMNLISFFYCVIWFLSQNVRQP